MSPPRIKNSFDCNPLNTDCNEVGIAVRVKSDELEPLSGCEGEMVYAPASPGSGVRMAVIYVPSETLRGVPIHATVEPTARPSTSVPSKLRTLSVFPTI